MSGMRRSWIWMWVLTGAVSLLGPGATPGARAAAIVDIAWVGTTGVGVGLGTDTITALPGDTLTAEISLTAGPEGVSGYALSLSFDADLEDELDLVSVSELLPVGFAFNITPGIAGSSESTAFVAGEVLTFEAVSFAPGPVSTTFVVASVVFEVTGNVVNDGLDVASGLFNLGIDDVLDNLDAPVAVTFGAATVNLVPEPATGLLVVAGLCALAAGRSRSQPRS